ncbi:hypothetical protein GCM10010517_82040 [Streptosporangium fragile]|uniref:Lantibiotic n=1 Tax=Streptosporangium fragile TaxID=46186 RepID=A0ABN3WKA0_9ACTN
MVNGLATTTKERKNIMELDITALDMLPAAEESKLKDCNVTCGLHTGTCSGQTMCHQTW